MNRFVVVGLGTFGSTLAARLYELGHDVVAIDIDQGHIDAIGPLVTRALVGDATQRDVLREAGAENATRASSRSARTSGPRCWRSSPCATSGSRACS